MDILDQNIQEAKKVAQDKDVKSRDGTQPKKYFNKKGDDKLAKSTKQDRARHFEKSAKKDDDDASAYEPAPGDAKAETKPSKHTKKFKKMFGEIDEAAADKSLQKKADKTGIAKGILKQVFNRGVAAWKTGHRPGTTPEQWGHARVNSFITKGKGTWGKADKDLADKVRGKSEQVVNEDNVAVRTALAKAKQVDEMEKLKLQHIKEIEALQAEHERENEGLAQQKEKEVQNMAIQKQREADRKAAEKSSTSESVEEGKLVADKNTIVDTILKKIKQKIEKEMSRNKESGLKLINDLGSMIGHKATDKKQEKGKLFLKFETELDEAKYTNIHNKIKNIRNLKRKESEAIANIDPAVMGQVVKALAPMFGLKEEISEVFLPYSQPWNDKKGLHQTLGLLKDTKSRKNAAKAIEKLAKKHKVEFEVDGQGQKQFVYLTSFDGKAIDKLKKDLMKNKKLTKALDTINGVFKEETMPGKGNASDDGVCEVGTDDIRQKYQADTPGQAEEGYIQETEKAFHEQKSKVKKNFRDVFQNPLKGYPANEDFEVKEIK